MCKVENLKKITLELEAGTSSQEMDLSLDNSEFEFIFGIGTSGISPFEYELVNKTEGQRVMMELKRDGLADFFEHLHQPILHLALDQQSLFLNVKIKKIAPVDHREVVKAMADLTSHGHGCDCGCGC
jgi:hypothetical protein